MRILTFISTIMLPLSVISGIYGMNVNLPFMQEGWVFGVIIAVMLIVVVGFIFYFKKKRWL